MRARLVQLVALLALAGLVWAAARFTPGINSGRKDLNMYASETPTETAPPEYAFAIQAFGAFRGLITNIAFIRAEEYKRAGRYYDAMQLASWICKLQPRFPSVWVFHSWNMAWNISVTTYTPQERWHWVYNGVKLIRDEGLKYNPRAVNLYRQLAWIFVNKMSETTDEFHMTYKRQWAYRMHLVLGEPADPLGEYRPGEPFEPLGRSIGDEADLLAKVSRHARQQRIERDRQEDPNHPERREEPNLPRDPTLDQQRPLEFEIVKKAAYDRLMQIANAPRTLAELYQAEPQTRKLVGRLREELGVRISDEELTEDEYWREGGLAFTFFRPWRQLEDPLGLRQQLTAQTGSGGADAGQTRLKRFDAIVGVREKRAAGLALLRFLQRKVLREVYKLDPAKMAELTARFGPMDWRVVDAHSLYWVNEGLIAGDETISSFKNDKVNTARLIFFSLRNLYLRNRLVFEPDHEDINRSYLNFNPDLNFVESLHRAYLAYGKLLDPDPEGGGVGGTFRAGHQNFLTEAIRMLYFAGREREAQRYFQYLRDNYSRAPDGSFNPYFARPLAEFVIETFMEDIDGWAPTRTAISALLARSFTELMRGNHALYNALVTKALDLHSRYNQGRMSEDTDKMQLPPFRDYQADVLREWFRQPAYAAEVTVNKARLWRVLPLYLKQAVYDDLLPMFRRECEAVGFDLSKAFPEPIGMEEYRKQAIRRAPADKQEDDVETPAQRRS